MTTQGATSDETITAAILVIGDEILSGRTKDKNIGWIAEHCGNIGIQVREVRIVGDFENEIVEAVNVLRQRYTYVFTTGGIGPTHDDITADSIAKAFGVGIDHHPQVKQALIDSFARRGIEATGARLRMARIPDTAEIVENRVSVAPGFKLGNVIVMAGIPAVMQVMLDAVTPRLKTGKKMLACSIELMRGEGEIAELFGAYLYADYCGGWVRSFRYSGGAATDQRDEPALAPGGNITSFGEDAAGEVYVLTQGGSIYRITGD